MSLKGDARQKSQLAIYHSGQEIEVGSVDALPLPLNTLLGMDSSSPWWVDTISSGLTGTVTKICVDGRFYNVKRKRDEILVKNPDGLTSFQNEIQIRRRVEAFKADPSKRDRFRNIVDTLYASQRHGIIVSPWIEAEPLTTVTRARIRSLFTTYLSLEMEGIFDLDPCGGNLLTRGDDIILFDFGYTYLFDPRVDFNPDGREFPLMHMAERFESRFYCQYLMDLEDSQGLETALEAFRMEKEVAIEIYSRKLSWLKSLPAEPAVLEYIQGFIREWEIGTSAPSALARLYSRETFLSYSMDAKDDLHGRSCTPNTLKKIDRIILAIQKEYAALKGKGLFWGEEAAMDQEEMISFWKSQRKLAEEYQLTH